MNLLDWWYKLNEIISQDNYVLRTEVSLVKFINGVRHLSSNLDTRFVSPLDWKRSTAL